MCNNKQTNRTFRVARASADGGDDVCLPAPAPAAARPRVWQQARRQRAPVPGRSCRRERSLPTMFHPTRSRALNGGLNSSSKSFYLIPFLASPSPLPLMVIPVPAPAGHAGSAVYVQACAAAVVAIDGACYCRDNPKEPDRAAPTSVFFCSFTGACRRSRVFAVSSKLACARQRARNVG